MSSIKFQRDDDYDYDATRKAYKSALDRNNAHWSEIMNFAQAFPEEAVNLLPSPKTLEFSGSKTNHSSF